MSHIKHPPTLKLHQQQINPWNVDDSNQLHMLESTTLSHYQPITRHTISFNPQSNSASPAKIRKPESKGYNFYDNLRKYEKKKAEEIAIKKNINFIQKNRQKIIEDNHPQPHQQNTNIMLNSHLFQHQLMIRGLESQFSSAIEPINWSLIMHYQSQKSKTKHKHKDIQSFLRFQQIKVDQLKKCKKAEEQSETNEDSPIWMKNESFRKILKLKEGIRRRNLKSASSSRQQIETSRQSNQQAQILRKSANISPPKKSQNTSQRKKAISSTSHSSRKQDKLKQMPCLIEVIGSSNKNSLTKKNQIISDLRMIHSSQKNRMPGKILNIEGSKLAQR